MYTDTKDIETAIRRIEIAQYAQQKKEIKEQFSSSHIEISKQTLALIKSKLEDFLQLINDINAEGL